MPHIGAANALGDQKARAGFRGLKERQNGSGRNIKLTTGAVEALRRHRKRQSEERMRLAAFWEDHGLIFPNQIDKTMDASNLIARSFKPLLAKSGLPHSVRLHDLRHTRATLLLSKNVHPKFVRELLGHATIVIT